MRPDVVGSGQSDQKIIGDDGEIMLTKFRTVFVAVFLLLPVASFGQTEGCGDPSRRDGGGYGPYDYTSPVDKVEHLPIVEQFHFTSDVENLIHGNTGSVGGDLDYTIRAFPNHHRALDAASRLSIKLKSARPPGLQCSVEGYFERGIRFKPDDAVLRMIYGLHFHRWKRPDQAKQQLEQAARLAPEDRNIAYNLGLIYVDLKEWDKASEYAEKAYGAGFPLPGLKNKLVKAGKWKEPRATPPGAEDASTAVAKPAGQPPGETRQ